MASGGKKRKTLGRGMADLIGNSLETLVSEGRARASAPPMSRPVMAVPEASEMPDQGFPSNSRVVAIASGKGGTGKSLLSVNLAVAMAHDYQVSLVDADFGLANAHILMGLLPHHDISHLLSGERSLNEVVMNGPRGVRLLPGASGIPAMASLDDDSLRRMASAVAPLIDESEMTILDCPGGLGRHSLLFLHGADIVLVVTTEDLTSMTDAYALIKTLVIHRPNATVGLVVNDAHSMSDGADIFRKLSHVSRKFLGRDILSLGTIPRDPDLERSVLERRPVIMSHPSSPASRAIVELAVRLTTIDGPRPALSFSQRLHRTLAAANGPGNELPRNGDSLCVS
jgi:flagellar biosynthesis protein FlhG